MSKRNYKINKKIFRIRFPSNIRFITTIFIVASLLLTVIFFVIVRYFNDAGVSGVDSPSVAANNKDAEQERIAIAKKVDTLVRVSGPESAQEYLNSEPGPHFMEFLGQYNVDEPLRINIDVADVNFESIKKCISIRYIDKSSYSFCKY